jgi:hypothetical protein
MSTGVRADRKIQGFMIDLCLKSPMKVANGQVGSSKATLKGWLTFDESTGYGLNDVMASFWSSWQSAITQSHVERTTLLATAKPDGCI